MAAIPSTSKRIYVLFFVLLLIIVIILTLAKFDKGEEGDAIDSFEECAAAGHPIMESYPERCAVPGGGTYTKQY